MGSDPLYYLATCVFRMAEPPYVLGGLAMLQGYLGAWLLGARQLEDRALVRFIRAYQRRALRVGKARAVAEIEADRKGVWQARTERALSATAGAGAQDQALRGPEP
jgi:hypothetical protein